MYRIAIVEDEKLHADRLDEYLRRYGKEQELAFRTAHFTDAVSFLESYQKGFDLIFLDIRMPGINGMEAARQLRKTDNDVQLIFVTSLVRYAVDGYTVGAADYIVKPFAYEVFSLKMTRALRLIPKKERFLSFRFGMSSYRFSADRIRYCIVEGHNVIYHLKGDTVTRRITMNEAAKELGDEFVKINSGCLANPDCIEAFDGETVTVAGEKLTVSQSCRKELARRMEERA